MLFCGIFGAILLAILSPWISEFSFGNKNYTWWLVALGAMVFFTALGSANTAILQGTRQLRNMAKASIWGAAISLCTSIPLYYFFGINGIVPALIVGAAAIYIVNWYYARQVKIEKIDMTLTESFLQGKEMAKLGVVMMISSLIGALIIYLVNAFITNYGSLSDVGLYGAGNSITNQYIGVVFVAMGVEYFPRLSAVCNDRKQCDQMVNQQAEMVILIAAPLLMAMILTAPFLIRILLTAEFLPISQFIRIVAFGMLFKASSYAIGYLSVAKGDKKLFFWLEGIYGNAITLVLNVAGYYFGGLIGLAISFVLSYVLYLTLITVVTRIRYGFILRAEFIKLFTVFAGLSLLIFIQTTFWETISGYIISILVFGAALWYAYRELDKRINIKQLIVSKLRGKSNEQ
ncbi:MAG: oligosaccharide flippase family protein, partial [Mucinivorans sp.]